VSRPDSQVKPVFCRLSRNARQAWRNEASPHTAYGVRATVRDSIYSVVAIRTRSGDFFRSEHFQLRNRCKTAAMQRAWAVPAQCIEMFGRAVSGIAFPTIVRVFGRRFAHQSVAIFLGQDGGGGNAGNAPVTPHDGASWPAPVLPASGRG